MLQLLAWNSNSSHEMIARPRTLCRLALATVAMLLVAEASANDEKAKEEEVAEGRGGEAGSSGRRFFFNLNGGFGRQQAMSYVEPAGPIAPKLTVLRPPPQIVQDVQIRPPAEVIHMPAAPAPAPAQYIVAGRAPPRILRPYVTKLPRNFRGYARDPSTGLPVLVVDPNYQCDANYVSSYKEALQEFVIGSVENYISEYAIQWRDVYEQHRFKRQLSEEVRRFTSATLQKLRPCHGLYISIEAIYKDFDDRLDDYIQELLSKY